MSEAEILSEEQAAEFLHRSVDWLRRSNVPVVRLPGRGGGKNTRGRLYLRSELLAYVRKYLSHSVADMADPQTARRPLVLRPHRRRSA